MQHFRPQPIGLFPFPASNLLLPRLDDDEEVEIVQSLLLGDTQIDLPRRWSFFGLAVCGEIERAVAALDGQDGDFLFEYNRFVLSPSRAAYDQLAPKLDGVERELLDLAAYAAQIVDSVAEKFSLDDELLAFALATSAAADIENGELELAIRKLLDAVTNCESVSPVFAATLISQAADLKMRTSEGNVAAAIQDFQYAIRLASNCKMPMLLPELHIKLGMTLQNAANGQRGALLQSVNAYQFALQNGVTVDEFPELFAQLQNNLGLAYLSMPSREASHQLRSGIAIQSFRHALRVYTIEDHPDRWASVSMNLANALQYAPTSHPEQNLIQAVEIYEEVLQVRSRAKDPVAYALVLTNQANALAHLGMFKPALEKLAEAYKLFHWYDKPEQAEAAREIVEQINDRMSHSDDPETITAS